MNQSALMDNLAKIADGIQAAKLVVTPELLDKAEELLPRVRAMVTPGPDGLTTADQAIAVLGKIRNHPRLVEALLAIL